MKNGYPTTPNGWLAAKKTNREGIDMKNRIIMKPRDENIHKTINNIKSFIWRLFNIFRKAE